MADIFDTFDKFGNRELYSASSPDINLGISKFSSFQTQVAVPDNINTAYSQIVDDDNLKPTDASRVTGGRQFDAVCSPYEQEGADFFGPDAIHKAINSGAKNIFVRNGKYQISDTTKTIQVYNSNVTITGESRENTILNNIGTTANFSILTLGDNVSTYSNFSITNLTLSGGSGSKILIYGRKYNNIKIENCIVKDNLNSLNSGALTFATCNNIVINNCYFKDTWTVFFLTSCSYMWLTNCFSDGADILGVFWSDNNYMTIANNIFTDANYGMFGQNNGNINFINNTFESVRNWTIYLDASERINIMGNNIYNCNLINLTDSSVCRISENLIVYDTTSPPSYLIAQSGSGNNFMITNNLLQGGSVAGYSATATNLVVANNLEI